MNYDEKKKLAIISIDIDKEGILNALTVLIEKRLLPRIYRDGFEIKINAILRLDTINEKLLVTF